MEEKKMQELSMEEMDKVSGGAFYSDSTLREAGITVGSECGEDGKYYFQGTLLNEKMIDWLVYYTKSCKGAIAPSITVASMNYNTKEPDTRRGKR